MRSEPAQEWSYADVLRAEANELRQTRGREVGRERERERENTTCSYVVGPSLPLSPASYASVLATHLHATAELHAELVRVWGELHVGDSACYEALHALRRNTADPRKEAQVVLAAQAVPQGV